MKHIITICTLAGVLGFYTTNECLGEVKLVPAKKDKAENIMVSNLGVKEVKDIIRKGHTFLDLKRKLKTPGFKSRAGKYTRYFLKDGAIDIPQKLKNKDVISGHKFGYKKKSK